MNYFIYNFLTKFIYILFFLTIICKYKQKIIYYKNNIRYIKDVLFIHGYDKKKDELSYKCFILNKIEELNASFIESSEYFYLNFEPNIVSDYRVIIISSTPLTKKIEEAIILAKKLNKKIIIDINDFIFNKKYKNSTSFVNCLFQNEKELYNETSFEIGKMLRLSDAAIISNEYLSNKLEDYVSKVFIKRNYANEEIWSLSQNVQKERNKSKLNSNIIIGYFCNCDN